MEKMLPESRVISLLRKQVSKVDWIWVLLLTWILGAGVSSLVTGCFAYDENPHLAYGWNILYNQNSDRVSYANYVDNSKMPITALNAVPLFFIDIDRLWIETADGWAFRMNAFHLGRFMLVVFATLLGHFMFCWARRWYGQYAGYLTLLLFAFCPNILAHSHIISNDVYTAGFVAFACYFFWKFMEGGGWRDAWTSAAVLGLAQLVKYTCLFLYPLFIFIVLIKYIRDYCKKDGGRQWPRVGVDLWNFLRFSLLYTVIGLLLINAGFFFNKTMTPLRDYTLSSGIFQALQKNPILGSIPLPLPYPYVQGLDISIENERTGATIGNIYLLGQIQESLTPEYKGFQGYYFIVSLFKVPIATLIFFLISVWLYWRNIKNFDFWGREIYIIVPVLFFMIMFNYFNKMQIGIRHFLIIFPLVFVFCGSLLNGLRLQKRPLIYWLFGLAGYLVVSVLSYFPYFMSYMNEFTLDRRKSYQIVADSNLDMGCNCDDLKAYLKQHPRAIVEPRKPVPGEIVVRVNYLAGIFEKERFRWLRENFEPDGHVAYSYLIYHIREADLDKLRSQ